MNRVLFLLLLPFFCSAQDLTGIWRGTFYTNRIESILGSNNKYEVQFDNSGRAVKGVTYSYQNTTFYGKASLIGMWTPDTKNLIFKEEKLLEFRNEGGEETVEMFTCYLQYRKEGNKEILEGDYTGRNYITGKDGGAGKIYLERVEKSDFKKEDFLSKKENKVKNTPPKTQITKQAPQKNKNPQKNIVRSTPPKPKNNIANKQTITSKTPKKTQPLQQQNTLPKKQDIKSDDIAKKDPIQPIKPAILPKVLKERKNELVRTIYTSGPEIEIDLYDNGDIDGDTISVFQNGKLIAYKKGLTAQPISIKLKIDENNPEQEITMVAENLGTIPPNTALMIVKTAGNRYDLGISSSEQKNAVVKFEYKKE